ncbi:MAG: hypothetical protein ACRD8U_15215, partial [Pyrinomonadaceae bacterium]
LLTVPKERLENFGKGVLVMKAIRNFAIAILIYAVAIIVTGKFLTATRSQLPFAVGSFIDALVSIGVLFNFIVLLLVSTRLMPATRAVVTSAIATFMLLAGVLSLISARTRRGAPNRTVYFIDGSKLPDLVRHSLAVGPETTFGATRYIDHHQNDESNSGSENLRADSCNFVDRS